MAGYAEPWNREAPSQLTIIEESGCTIVTVSPNINSLVNSLVTTLVQENTSTVLIINAGKKLPYLLLPLRGIDRYRVNSKL